MRVSQRARERTLHRAGIDRMVVVSIYTVCAVKASESVLQSRSTTGVTRMMTWTRLPDVGTSTGSRKSHGTIIPAARMDRRSASEDSKALVVPAMVPSYRNIIPGFPTLQVSPHTVAQAIGSAHAPSLSVQDGALYNSRAQENYLSYHSHGLPRTTTSLSSPFESLLTAVNVAARIEEPTPSKGRNDSVIICNLDAQAIAAERTGQHLPAWNFDPGHGDVGVDQYGEYVPSPTDYNVGVGLPSPMGHVPTSMTFSSKMDHTGYNSPILPSIVSDPIYMHQHALMQPYRHIAPDLRFCLEPAFD
jgi:hypothetical protein